MMIRAEMLTTMTPRHAANSTNFPLSAAAIPAMTPAGPAATIATSANAFSDLDTWESSSANRRLARRCEDVVDPETSQAHATFRNFWQTTGLQAWTL
jgi:hypothetical protein